MDEGLLVTERLSERSRRWREIMGEMKRLGYLAGPMVAVTLSVYLLQVISLTMVGHLGELALASTAIAISLAGVTGFSLLMGMASALETISGQAFGAEQYKKIGTQTYNYCFSDYCLHSCVHSVDVCGEFAQICRPRSSDFS